MAPTVPPLVETLSVESVLPPSGRLGELAATAVQLASDPDAAALDGLLAADADATEILRGLRVAAALYGPFGEPEPVGGDGETTTTLRLPGPRGERRPRAGARRERRPPGDAHPAPRAAELGRAYIRVRHALCVPDPGLCD